MLKRLNKFGGNPLILPGSRQMVPRNKVMGAILLMVRLRGIATRTKRSVFRSKLRLKDTPSPFE